MMKKLFYSVLYLEYPFKQRTLDHESAMQISIMKRKLAFTDIRESPDKDILLLLVMI